MWICSNSQLATMFKLNTIICSGALTGIVLADVPGAPVMTTSTEPSGSDVFEAEIIALKEHVAVMQRNMLMMREEVEFLKQDHGTKIQILKEDCEQRINGMENSIHGLTHRVGETF